MYKYLGNSCVLRRIYQPFICTFFPLKKKKEKMMVLELSRIFVWCYFDFFCKTKDVFGLQKRLCLAACKVTNSPQAILYCIMNQPDSDCSVPTSLHPAWQGTLCNSLYGEAMPERGTFPSLQVHVLIKGYGFDKMRYMEEYWSQSILTPARTCTWGKVYTL